VNDSHVTLLQGDALSVLKTMPAESIDCVMTSPPYWGLRNYHVDGQVGLEKTYQEYIDHLILIFSEVKRVLKKTGTCWVNIADSYAGSGKGIGTDRTKCKEVYTDDDINKTAWQNVGVPSKSLIGIPERFALAMTDRLGFIRRNTIIWYKRNPMPESVKDRFTEDFEYVYLFSKQSKYYFEQQFEPAFDWGTRDRSDFRDGTDDPLLKHHGLSGRTWAVGVGQDSELGTKGRCGDSVNRNRRCVWDIPTSSNGYQHYAAYPEKLCETPILAGCPSDGVVLDPFAGTGTTGAVSKRLCRKSVLIELNTEYCEIIKKRMESISMPMELSL
jgi:DNA modification methylase